MAGSHHYEGVEAVNKPSLSLAQIINMAVGFFGIQIAFALQGGNASRIFETLGANPDKLALYWIAGPLTGLIVQPIVGHMSDNTWTRFGRRRPFFVAGAIWAAIALFFMPRVPELWMAILSLWILDASINVSMEPFRAFVGDLLTAKQRTAGYAVQTVFIGLGGILGAWLPPILEVMGVSNESINGKLPDTVTYSFFIGAILIVLSIGYTVLTTKEYSPEQAKAFNKAEIEGAGEEVYAPARKSQKFFISWGVVTMVLGGAIFAATHYLGFKRDVYILGGGVFVLGLLFVLNAVMSRNDNFLTSVMDDLIGMPRLMKQLAVVQFFSWIGFFVMWIYTTNAVACEFYGNCDPASTEFQSAGNWVNILFGIYAAVSAIYAFIIPLLAKRFGLRVTHAFGLICGAIGMASYLIASDKNMLILTMVFIGIAWGSVLTMPYAILSNGIPPRKMGIYMGIFNFFIVLPQLIVATIMGTILDQILGGRTLLIFIFGAVSFLLAAISLYFVDSTRNRREGNLATK